VILDTATRSARIVLGEAVTTTAPTVCAFWADQTSGTGGFLPGDTNSATNGTTPVTIVAAPAAGVQRAVTEIKVYNADTVQHVVTLQLDDNGTIYDVESYTVPAGNTYTYLAGAASGTNAATSTSSAILVETGSSTKISAMSSASALNGTEKMAGVQSGGNVAITGGNLGLLVLSEAFTTYPLDATTTTGNGTAALIRGGNGGSSSGNGAKVTIQGGNATSGNAGSVILQAGTTVGGGTNGHVLVNTTTDDGTDALQVNGSAMASSFVVTASGPTWTEGSAAPAASQPVGSIYSRTGGAAGTSLYVSAGSGNWNPVSGGWQEIASYTIAAASSQTIPFSGFRAYQLRLLGITVGTSAASIAMQLSINGGTSFIASGYAQFGTYISSTTTVNFNTTGTTIICGLGLSTASSAVMEGIYDIYPGTAALAAIVSGKVSGFSSAPAWFTGSFCGASVAGAAVNALQLTASSGNFSGTAIILGLV
jgi:hypothetical protein